MNALRRAPQSPLSGTLDRAPGFNQAILSGPQLDRRPELIVRLPGDDVDGATDGIAPEQGSLRTAQHFDALHVHQVRGLTHHAAHEHAIEIKPYGRVLDNDEVRLTHAADKHHRRLHTAGAAGAFKVHVGHDLADDIEVRFASGEDLLAGNHRNRRRHVLQAFLAAPRGHHDFLEGARGGLVIRGANIPCQRQKRGGRQQGDHQGCVSKYDG